VINYPRSDKTGAGRFLPSWKLVLGLMLSGIVLAAGAFALAVFLIPVPDQNDVALAETTKVTYADGKNVIGRVGDVRRTSIPLSEVPEHVQYAVLAAEDRDFYDHGGFSIQGITRAFVNNISGGDKQGGSTITQQYVKNAYLTQEQTWTRKLKELILSVKLETIESKDQILEDYLNTIYFGRGAYGIEAASEVYFGKKTAKLTLEEGAALAAIIQSPGNFEPSLYPDELQARWNYVLEGMLSEGWITQQEYQNAEFPKFKKLKSKNQYAGQNGYIIEAVRREMVEMGWTEAELNQGGLTIVTTIDRKAQSSAVTAVETAGPQYDDQRVRIGLAAVRPVTGEIAAIYGGKDYLDNQLDNALQARAQAGSTFKAFTLAAALEEDFGLDSTWNGNSPATVQGYTLQNFANASYGTVTLLQATTKSINTAYVDAEATVGVKESINAAERLGLPADTPGIEPNLTFVLGSASPRAIDMAASFSTFAGRGTAATRKCLFVLATGTPNP
jgi:membrane peptidoglycan carboxypeptidase